MNPIKMVDLTTQYTRIHNEINTAVLQVLASGDYINGEAVRQFSEDLCAYTKAKYTIPCANGTDALQVALMSMDADPGDEVIVPAFTYAASAEVCALLGLTPVFVDVNPQTFNIDETKIEGAISAQTKAIMPVHLFGQCANMEKIMAIAKKYNLYVIEDNAQSIGAVYTFSNGDQKYSGTIGNAGAISFFPTKNLGCAGDGGALQTNDEKHAKLLGMIASHGQSKKYIHEVIGCNSRLDTVQAAILRVKLQHLDDYIAKRRWAAGLYREGLSGVEYLTLPYEESYTTHVYNQFTLQVKEGRRDALQDFLKEKGIPTVVYYPLPMHKQPAFLNQMRMGGEVKTAETLCKTALSLPMHTELEEEQIQYIVEQIKAYGKL